MAYTAKCDTATHTKWWITGTGTAVNRLSEVMDDNASGVEEDDNPGNYQPWSEFMTEHVEDGVYQIHENLEVGDGSTSTTLTSIRESVYFDDAVIFTCKSAATLQLGAKSGSHGVDGAMWNFGPTAHMNFTAAADTTANVGIYASLLHHRTAYSIYFREGTLEILNSILAARWADDSATYRRYELQTPAGTKTLTDVFVCNVNSLVIKSAVTATGVHVHRCGTGGWFESSQSFDGAKVTSATSFDVQSVLAGTTATFKDPVNAIGTVKINEASGVIIEQYTCNIHVADKDGANLASVTVACDSDAEGAEFSVSTDANGDITEQTIDYKSWTTTAETLTSYSPHTFTISKAGYETLVLEAITVDGPINWHLELQDPAGGGLITHPGMSGGARG